MIEFNTNLTSPPDSGYLSVVNVQTTSALTTISQGISLIATPGTATVSNYTAALADYYDPEDVATAGHFTSFPFGDSATAQKALDHNFAVQVQGSIQIATAGTYTFDVTSSDGFQLSIGAQTFTGSSTGTTYGSTMTYSGTRTIADSLGVTTFTAAGTYPIDLYYFNGATDAPRLELSAAAGTQTSFGASFHLIGDTINGGLSVKSNFSYVPPPFSVGVNTLATGNASPALTGTISDPAASVTVRVNGSSYAATNNGDGTWSLPQGTILPLATGTYNVVAAGTNLSGIVAFDSTVNELSINATFPTVSITSPPASTQSPVNSIAIVFSKPVENFTLQDLQLTFANGGPAASEPLEGATLTTTDDQNWTLGNLAGLTTASGSYTLTLVGLGSTVTDMFGNPLLTSASGTWLLGTPPTVAANAVNQTVVAGGMASFTAAANGYPTPMAEWDVSTDGGTTFSPISGATSPTYSFTTNAAENGCQYEAVFTNMFGNVTTTVAALTVDYAPSVTIYPPNPTVPAGGTASFAAVAGGNPVPTVQWDVSSNGGTTFSPIAGATSTTYSFTANAGENGYQYEAVCTNSVGSTTSTAATLTVFSVATVATWNSAGDGAWNSASNWGDTQGTGVPGFSGVAGDQASFNGAAELNADLGNFSPSIAGLSFGPNALNYDIESSGSGALHLNDASSNATITVSAGSQTIAAPLALDSSVLVAPASGSRLAISGPISGTGSSLTLGGLGTLVLSGANSYNGGTTVSAGTLILSNSSAIAAYTNLTVGAGGTLIFDPSVTASYATTAAASIDTSVTAAVPATMKAASSSLIVAASLPASSSPAVIVAAATVLSTDAVAGRPAPQDWLPQSGPRLGSSGL